MLYGTITKKIFIIEFLAKILQYWKMFIILILLSRSSRSLILNCLDKILKLRQCFCTIKELNFVQARRRGGGGQ